MAKESLFKKNIWKWLVLAVISFSSVYLVTPIKEKVRLGLDLNGGTRFTLEVDKEKLHSRLLERNPQWANQPERIEEEMAKTLEGSEDRIVEIIRRRVDSMGTNEPGIQSIKGKNQFIVELPGVGQETTDAASKRLRDMAYLEFRLVPENEYSLLASIPKDKAPLGYEVAVGGYVRTANYEEISSQSNYLAKVSSFGVTERGIKFILERVDGRKSSDGRTLYHGRFVESQVRFTGDGVSSATAEPNEGLKAGYHIAFVLKDDAAGKFADLTRENRGRLLAIILDDELVSAPRINDAIELGKGEISGDFSLEEAKNLANDLNAGALPAPLKIAAASTVAPTVGADAIDSGINAAAIGFMLIALFMIFYYWRAGFVANVALLLDVLLLPAALFLVANILGVFVNNSEVAQSGVQLPVLTMPGIAGLVLTLGMAVDANVIIYERIREEFARGVKAGSAISAGYGKAFSAILDSNITTILTGIILYVVGTGPVRGFAIMLIGGVVISMFTAIVVTRLVFDHTVNPERTAPFKMSQFFKNPNFDFMKYARPAMIASALIIVATVGLFTYRVITNPTSVLAVDLTGGTAIVYSVKGDVDVGDVRKAIESFDNAALIQTGSGEGDTSILSIKTGISDGDTEAKISKLLKDSGKFSASELTVKSCDVIGPTVGADLRSSGSKAVIFSIIAILIYIGLRFRFGFGLGGVVALAHDALIAFGLFSLCGRQVSLIVITALLTIIGYSINDTVVIFDRIREILKRDPRTPLKEVCNLAQNSCLGRTVITSLTTFFTVAVLFIFVDGSIYDFALTMLFGIIAGTYSSIFIATPVMVWWYRGKRPDFSEEDTKEAK